MRLIHIDEYDPKLMQLARPIFDKQKRVLLGAGRSIHPTYLKKMMELDINYLFIEEAKSFGISLEEMLDLPTWMDAINTLQNAFQAASQNKELPIRELQRQCLKLVDEVSKRKALCLIPTTSLAKELRPYAHAVNVTMLSLQVAKKLLISQIQLKDLALGCMLHDIGKVIASENESHTVAGFEYLRKIKEINLLAAHVAYQHHELFDGTGEPRGLVDKEIHEFAQICSIADLYENMISKEGLPPHEAMEYIMTKSGTMFSTELLNVFVQQVPSYIPGTEVLLNNGRNGIVTKIIGSMQRPYIRYLDTGEEFSLANHNTLLISKVLSGKKVMGEGVGEKV